jgi:hypothetical protein
VDFEGLGRAAWTDLRAWEVQEGGSTISEQLMKNLYVPADERLEISFWRRFVQSSLAYAYERNHSKGAGPHGLPEHRVLRRRGIWGRGRGPSLLRQARQRVDPLRGGHPRRLPSRPLELLDLGGRGNPRADHGAPGQGLEAHGRAGHDLRRRAQGGQRGPPGVRPRPTAARPRVRTLLGEGAPRPRGRAGAGGPRASGG